jgi:hypothetical protein
MENIIGVILILSVFPLTGGWLIKHVERSCQQQRCTPAHDIDCGRWLGMLFFVIGVALIISQGLSS